MIFKISCCKEAKPVFNPFWVTERELHAFATSGIPARTGSSFRRRGPPTTRQRGRRGTHFAFGLGSFKFFTNGKWQRNSILSLPNFGTLGGELRSQRSKCTHYWSSLWVEFKCEHFILLSKQQFHQTMGTGGVLSNGPCLQVLAWLMA